MVNTDEDALVCDLAEVYRIYDYKSLPCSKVAIFSCGLRNESRIKMKLQGENYSSLEKLVALAVDHLALLVWSKTKDGEKGTNRPKSIFEQMASENTEPEVQQFESGEDFMKARARYIKGGTNGE